MVSVKRVSADPICDVLLRLRALAGLSLRQVLAEVVETMLPPEPMTEES